MLDTNQIVESAKQTKNALISKWILDKQFVDCNKMTENGILSESVGLNALLYLTTCFKDESSFWNKGDHDEVDKIVKSSIDKIYKYATEKGLDATPLVPEGIVDFFDKDQGYTDSVCWVLSGIIQARYNQRKGNINLGDEHKSKMFELIALCLRHIINAEDEGRWGFLTSSKPDASLGEPALFYTYCVAGSINDFFDYISGEILAVETANDDRETFRDYKDIELITFLNAELGMDVEAKLREMCNRTAWWLVAYCLPNLPDIASCTADEDLCNRLGIWFPGTNDYEPYLFLYYSAYIIDMMTLCDTEKLFPTFIEQRYDELVEIYSRELTNKVDLMYFFKGKKRTKEDLYENFYKGYIEQAIQLSKNKFMEASRTGDLFWDSEDSELAIVWKPKDPNLVPYAQKINKKHYITEPALVPMSVKSSIDFCYYISQEPDFTIEKRYNMTIQSRSDTTENNRVKDLWDNTNYNLFVTERSIESLVDFYDYAYKFNKQTGNVSEVPASSSEFEKLLSDLIDKRISERLGDAPVSTTVEAPLESQTSIEEQIDRLHAALFNNQDIYDSFESDHVLVKLLEIFDRLSDERHLMDYHKKTGIAYNSQDACDKLGTYREKVRVLLRTLMDDNTTSSDWSGMYEHYKRY